MSNHYSDVELLSLLDGETNHIDKVKSWLHLRRCWTCRARTAELESEAHRFALALQRDDYPGADRVAKAKQDFLNRARAYSGPSRPTAKPFHHPAIRRVAWLTPAFAGLVLAAMGTVGVLITREYYYAPPKKAPTTVNEARRPLTASAMLPEHPPVPLSPFHAKTPSSPPQPETATPVQLDAAEIEARYALHRANLDLAPVEFAQSSGRLTIRGYSAEQQAALRYLEQRGYVRLEFERPDLPDGPVTAVAAPPANRRALIEDRLSARFGGQSFPSAEDRNRAYAAYLNEMVSLATKAKGAATALNRLADRYQTAHLGEFSAEHRWLLEAMIRDHLRSLDMITERERTLLDPVFPGGAARNSSRGQSWSSWPGICRQLFSEVSASQDEIVEIFASRDASDRDVGEAVARIQNQLYEWPGRRAEAELIISREFTARSEKR